MKKLPIGNQSFKNIIAEKYCYADKTRQLCQLVNNGKYYFLSRPNGFGKSLLLSTLKSAFLGEKSLFKGLYLENHWNWANQSPVISIPVNQGIGYILQENSKKYEIVLESKAIKTQFAELIQKVHHKYQQKVVILIDDYDKLIVDHFFKSKRFPVLKQELEKFYTVIKDNDEYISFAFLTGISNLSKISFFQDISLDKRYAEICGYTETELKTIFNDYSKIRDFEQLKQLYYGYNFLGEKVYNPANVLSYLESSEFQTFTQLQDLNLIKKFCKKQYLIPNLENLKVSQNFFENQESLESLLFKKGYLTIQQKQTLGVKNFYNLTYPNIQVSMNFMDSILSYLTKNSLEKDNLMLKLYQALEAAEVGALKDIIQGFFIISKVYDCISIVYCYFVAIGLEIIIENLEYKQHLGQIDFTVKLAKKVYIIEFKLIDNNSSTPLEQIKDKQYFRKYINETNTIYLIGITFNQIQREIVNFQAEKLYVILNNRKGEGENRYLFETCTRDVNCKNSLLIG